MRSPTPLNVVSAWTLVLGRDRFGVAAHYMVRPHVVNRVYSGATTNILRLRCCWILGEHAISRDDAGYGSRIRNRSNGCGAESGPGSIYPHCPVNASISNKAGDKPTLEADCVVFTAVAEIHATCSELRGSP